VLAGALPAVWWGELAVVEHYSSADVDAGKHGMRTTWSGRGCSPWSTLHTRSRATAAVDRRTCASAELAERHRRGAGRPPLPPAGHARRTSSQNGTATTSSARQEFKRFIAEVDEAEGRAHAMTDLNT
jgi:hypothetical protein